jgi:hypothetical protein
MVFQRWSGVRKTGFGQTSYRSGGYKKGYNSRGGFGPQRLGFLRSRFPNVQRGKAFTSYRRKPYGGGKPIGPGRSVVSKREVLPVLDDVSKRLSVFNLAN